MLRLNILLLSTFAKGAFSWSVATKLNKLGHKVYGFDYRAAIEMFGFKGMEEKIVALQKDCDLNFVIKGEEIDSTIFEKPSVLYFTDSVEIFPEFFDNYKHYNYVYTEDTLAPGGIHYISHGVDLDVFYHIPTSKSCFIGFAATSRPERVEYLERIWKKYGDKLQVYGNDWNPELPYYHGTAIYGEELNRFYSGCTFIFDLDRAEGVDWRVYEAMAIAGGIVVTNRSKTKEKHFKHGEHLFFYDDIEDLFQILDNPPTLEEQQKVIKTAHEKVKKEHNLEDRIKQIMDNVKL